MKKTTLLNSDLSCVISRLGHNDLLAIGDAGLPIPPGTPRIDLALVRGVPGFSQTLQAVLAEMQVERIVLANETSQVSPQVFAEIQALLPEIPIEWVSHEAFKQRTAAARAVVRTGECTPYANVILVAGVAF